MQSNVMIGIGAIGAISLLAVPSTAIPIGNYYTNQLSNDEIDKVQAWRNARFFYRVSKFSPLLWESSTERIRNADLSLSTSMFTS